MEFKSPIILIVGTSLVLILFFLSFLVKLKNRDTYRKGKKIANTKFIRETPIYKKLMVRYKIWIAIGRIAGAVSLIAAVVLWAAPFIYKVTTTTLYNRDIFLCMDVSTSVDELNMNLVDQFKDNSFGLSGEQVGISIFNTSSVLLVPLTSDYEYVDGELENIKTALMLRNDPGYSYYDDLYMYYYIISGTLVGNEARGSSLIGDGLASCLYDFPDNPENERTQIVILTTDNDPAGEELLTLTQACALAKSKGIIVYGIAPMEPAGSGLESQLKLMEEGVKSTGGSFYVATNNKAVEEVLEDIKTREASKLEKTDTYLQIQPFVPFVCLTVGLSLLAFSRKKVLV